MYIDINITANSRAGRFQPATTMIYLFDNLRGRTGGQTGGQTRGRTGGRMDGLADKREDRRFIGHTAQCTKLPTCMIYTKAHLKDRSMIRTVDLNMLMY